MKNLDGNARLGPILFLMALLIFSFVQISAAQEEENLLTNPGFEAPFVEQGGNPMRLVASGWTAWHTERSDDDPSFANRQPEYQPVAPDTARIWEGENAQLLFNNTWYTHEGGVYQQVENTTPGAELQFSVYAYIWSSSFDDVEISEDPAGVTLQVGIDPTGGTDPQSSNIVWSLAVEQYDAYRQYRVLANATNNTVTVWVRSRIAEPKQNSYIYLDQAFLGETVTTNILTDTPQPGPTEIVQLDTPTVPPTNTTVPRATDLPTDTPVPTATELPTSTPAPTNTVPPTTTPQPTNTAPPGIDPTPTQEASRVPSATPLATDTPDGNIVVVPLDPTVTAMPTSTPAANEVVEEPVADVAFRSTLNYTVQRGDTVGRIAFLYGSTVEAISTANDLNEDNLIFVGQSLIIPIPLAAPATSTPTPSPTPTITPSPTITPEIIAPETGGAGPSSSSVYVVQRGDTLSSIASRFGVSIVDLAQRNGIVNANLIFAGQQLQIPASAPVVSPNPTVVLEVEIIRPQTYLVQPGDNLYRISLRFGVTMRAIAEANGILNANRIFAGQVLVIP